MRCTSLKVSHSAPVEKDDANTRCGSKSKMERRRIRKRFAAMKGDPEQ